jgi:hypothetical protein
MKRKVEWKTESGTVFRVEEIDAEMAKNESGEVPVYIAVEKNVKKKGIN